MLLNLNIVYFELTLKLLSCLNQNDTAKAFGFLILHIPTSTFLLRK